MDIYDTLYMLAAIEELTPEPTFFKRRYFPTDLASDVFGTSKVLADYKEGSRKAAPFVVPRIGALPVGRSGLSTYELEPGNIAISKPLTIDQLTRRGKAATDLVVSNDVGNFLMEDPWIQYMMDNRRADYGAINPDALTEYVVSLGRFNFGGRRLEIFVNDGTFEDQDGKDIPFLEEGSAIVTAPNCGKGLYGAVTQKEMDNQWHTHAGMRVPNRISTIKPPADETIVSCRPLFAPKTVSPMQHD